jgi:2'-5' RNA ligase
VTSSTNELETIRTFFALRLRDPIKRQLANCADSLAVYDKRVQVDWVDSENYHLTLCFLGELPIPQVDELSKAAQEHLVGEQSVNIHLHAMESYQSASNWTLLVAKASHSPELNALNTLVRKFVKQTGIDINMDDFYPHITLGRLDQGHSFKMPKKWPSLNLYSLADAVVLLQSKEGERGSVYTPLSIVELEDIS